MDAKLKQILQMALRADTGEGESAAALAAARRLVSKHGLDQLWDATPTEKIVYKDRVVYRDAHAHTHNRAWKLTVPARYLHTMLERVLLDGDDLGCMVKLVSCKPVGGVIMSPTVIEIKVYGTPGTLKRYEKLIKGYIDKIKQDGDQDHTHQSSPKPAAPVKRKSWFSKLFGG